MSKLLYCAIAILILNFCSTSGYRFDFSGLLDSNSASNEAYSDEEFDLESAGHEEIKSKNNGKIWAVLVAGSNGFDNYRHQADICHAYHILRNHGVPAENIITLMYDDIANNPENPYPGKIFNSPTGPDVYAGVKIDYTGESVNPDNFVAILLGDKSAIKGGNGRVLESTENDKVFIYFADHGDTGLICFPDSDLSAKTLQDTLLKMNKKQMYKEMTIYVEACYSGTMFSGLLPPKLNIYAVTAANTEESSWGDYCDTPKLPDNCLGDLFSTNWMEDSDKEDLNKETLETQFKIVRRETNMSHPQQYGDKDFTTEIVGDFQGDKSDQMAWRRMRAKSNVHDYAMWDSHEIPLMILKKKFQREENPKQKQRLAREIRILLKKRRYLEGQIVKIVKKVVRDPVIRSKVLTIHPAQITQLQCHHEVMQAFHENCFSVGKNPYVTKYGYVLANLCEQKIKADQIKRVLTKHCASIFVDGIK